MTMRRRSVPALWIAAVLAVCCSGTAALAGVDTTDIPPGRYLERAIQRRFLRHVHAQVDADGVETEWVDHAFEPER